MSLISPPRAGVLLTLGLAVMACGGEKLGPEDIVTQIDITPGTWRAYAVGQQQVFSAALTTEAGTSGEGIEVGWKSRNETLLTINSAGVATVQSKGGNTWIVATAGGKSDSVAVEIPTTSCGSVAATAMAVAQVVSDKAEFCAGASTGEYTVILHNNSLAASGSSSVEISAIAVGAAPGTGGATFSRALAPASTSFGASLQRWRRDVAAEMRHRRGEAAEAAQRAAGARAWYEAQRKNRASFAAAAPAVGDVMTINVNINSTSGCNDPRTDISARVAAISNSAIVLADPRNPAVSAYTDAEYNQFAQMFDSVINRLDTTQFGAPTDLDNNQRVLLVFTRSVNERTPAGASYYVGGLTHTRDLLPKAGSGTTAACPGSNEAEMFYLLVPDSLGTINSNSFEKSFVNSVTDATVAHEYQHLINFARRRYINPGFPQPSEELWLNEGLSHMAEELLYYRRSGRSPRTNIGFSQIFASQATFNLFAYYMAGDFLNYDEYVFRPTETSPFEAGDELATRGATWAFLRYAADQTFASDGNLWRLLVNSGEVGTTNLQNRLGTNAAGLRALLRDFTVTVYTDDYIPDPSVPSQTLPVAAKYTHPSWNMRSVYPGLVQPFLWPMALGLLEEGETNAITLQAGGFKAYRFKGISGADSFIRVTGGLGSALPAGVSFSVIRTK